MSLPSAKLHISRLPRAESPGFNVVLGYRIEHGGGEPRACFELQGHVDEQPLDERFELGRDRADNFLHYASRCLHQRGVIPRHAALFRLHPQYDQLFEEVRAGLGCKPGDSVDLGRLLRDG